MHFVRLSVLMLALGSALATSSYEPIFEVEGDVVLLNTSDQDLVVEVQNLLAARQMDCDAIEADPSVLDSSFFSTSLTLTIPPHELAAVRPDPWSTEAPCYAVRITHVTHGTRLLFWRTEDLLVSFHPNPVEDLSLALHGTVVIGDAPGQGFNDGGDGIVFPAESELPSCAPELPLTWSGPTEGTWTLGSATREGGCTTWTVEEDDSPTDALEICVPQALLEAPHGQTFDAGDRVRLYSDDEALRMSQESGRELELIVSTTQTRTPYALQLTPLASPPTCTHATDTLTLLVDSGFLASNGTHEPTPLELGTPVQMHLTEGRDGQVMLANGLTAAVHTPDTSPEPLFGIGALSWRVD